MWPAAASLMPDGNSAPSNFEQAKARIHRVGQGEKCTYIYLTAWGTVDEKVLRALREKADLARLLVDDYRQGGNPYG
jgi:SNF2 family DNA or RNA helicase